MASENEAIETIEPDQQAPATCTAEPRPELPVWRLGSASSFHRRDIYDHAR